MINGFSKRKRPILEPCLQGMEAPKSGGAATGISNYTPALSQTVTIYREKSLLARLNMLKHDSDIIGTKYEQKWKNWFFDFFTIFSSFFRCWDFPLLLLSLNKDLLRI